MPIEASHIFEHLLRSVEDTPIDAIRECRSLYRKAERTHNQRLYETLAVAAAFVIKLRNSPENRAAFLKLEFFDDLRGTPSDDDLPRLVLRYLLGAAKPKGALYEQARSHAQVVQHFLDQDIPPQELLGRLSEASVHSIKLLIPKRREKATVETPDVTSGPIRAVPKVHRGAREAIKEPHSEAEKGGVEQEDDEEPDLLALDEPTEAEHETGRLGGRSIQAERPEAKRGSGDSGETPDRRPAFNSHRDVSFDAGLHFSMILGIEEGDEVKVTLRREASDTKWVKLRSINAERVLRSGPHLH